MCACKGTRNTNRRAYYWVVNDMIDNSVLVGAGSASGSTDTVISEADRNCGESVTTGPWVWAPCLKNAAQDPILLSSTTGGFLIAYDTKGVCGNGLHACYRRVAVESGQREPNYWRSREMKKNRLVRLTEEEGENGKYREPYT